MKGLSSQLKSTLQELALQMNIPFGAKETRGELLLKIRETTEEAPNQKMTFGKYKNHQLKEALEDVSYSEWALDQEFSHPQGNLLKAMAALHYGMFLQMTRETESQKVPPKEEYARMKKEMEELKKEKFVLKKEKYEGRPEMKKEPKENPKAWEVPIHSETDSSEELVEDDRVEKKKVRNLTKAKDEDTSDTPVDWMQLGEKRKARTIKSTSSSSKGK